MLYVKKKKPFCEEDFKNPSSEYRGAPFWAWNCKMKPEDVSKMMDMFEKMGMGDAHIHSRTGMGLPYLQEEFMARVKQTCACAKEKNMHVWLYDEDRWPSGYGGGYITEDDRYRCRMLTMSPVKIDEKSNRSSWTMTANGNCVRGDKRSLLGIYEVQLDKQGWLLGYKKISEEEAMKADADTLWYAYLEISANNPWFNDQAYSNNLDPESVKKFIKVTHEAYYKNVGKEFGDLIPAIFTDEPQFNMKQNQAEALDRETFSIPFTDDLPDTYRAAYGEEFMEHLPEVIWDRKEHYSVTRYRYHNHLTERFVSAYMDQLAQWCEEHHLALTGHVMRESSLKLQSGSVGEAMRCYRKMQLPGIDMLAWRTEYNTAKQCQSIVHQYGREGMLSELYGVTDWDFDFRNHKVLGDWQAALGVTIRVHHLSWTSMAGEAKRDYPAAISYQSPWYKEYKLVEDYFARVNTAMTRGTFTTNLGVLHPIESYWMCYGAEDKTGQLRRELDDNYDMLTRWLIGDAKDFDLIAESLVKELYKGTENGRLQIGEMSYHTILAPNMLTIRSETLQMLKEFKAAGGRVIFTGYTPKYVDGMLCEDAQDFVKECEWISFGRNTILTALDGVSGLELIGSDGMHTENLITQMRQDGEERWIFVAHKPEWGQDQIVGAGAYTTNEARQIWKKQDRTDAQKIAVKIAGNWSVKNYDAWNGKISEMECVYKAGHTYVYTEVYGQDSLLLRLVPQQEKITQEKTNEKWKKEVRSETPIFFEHEAEVTLSEPNVLLLDMAEYAFDDGEWMPREEILRLDNKYRDKLGLKYRMEAFPQPWVLQEEAEKSHILHLRFRVHSKVEVENAELALEHPQDCTIMWNEKSVDSTPTGNYVDRDIKRISLGKIKKGENILLISMPFGLKTDVEAVYVLGDFGVHVAGDSAVITEPVRKMHFGSWIMEGLPFYGGNVTYHIPVLGHGRALRVALSKFRNPAIEVALDGKKQGMIAISPYEVVTEMLEEGAHMLDITVYGNRYNTFGALHNTDAGKDVYCSPNHWRSIGSLWSYEYQLRMTGPLTAPKITEI